MAADTGQARKGQFFCQWNNQPHGLSLSLTMGEGLGALRLGEALLPTSPGIQPDALAVNYMTNILKAMREACSAALLDQGWTSHRSEPTTGETPEPLKATPVPHHPVMVVPPRPEKVTRPAPPVAASEAAPTAPIPAGSRVLFGVRPTPRTSPVRFGFGIRQFPVTTWKGILISACSYLVINNPTKLKAAFEDDEFKGHKHRTLSLIPTVLRGPQRISSGEEILGYVETSMSSKDLLFHTAKLLRYCGVDTTDAWYEVG